MGRALLTHRPRHVAEEYAWLSLPGDHWAIRELLASIADDAGMSDKLRAIEADSSM